LTQDGNDAQCAAVKPKRTHTCTRKLHPRRWLTPVRPPIWRLPSGTGRSRGGPHDAGKSDRQLCRDRKSPGHLLPGGLPVSSGVRARAAGDRFLGMRQGARGCITRHAIKLFDPSIYPGPEQYWTDMGRIAAQTSLWQIVSSPNLVARDVYEEHTASVTCKWRPLTASTWLTLRMARTWRACRRAPPGGMAPIYRCDFQLGTGAHRHPARDRDLHHAARGAGPGGSAPHGLCARRHQARHIMIDRLGYVKLVDSAARSLPTKRPTFYWVRRSTWPGNTSPRTEPVSIRPLQPGTGGLEMLRGAPFADYAQMSETELLAI